MTTTDTTERGLEQLICTPLIGAPRNPEAVRDDEARERTVRRRWVADPVFRLMYKFPEQGRAS